MAAALLTFSGVGGADCFPVRRRWPAATDEKALHVRDVGCDEFGHANDEVLRAFGRLTVS